MEEASSSETLVLPNHTASQPQSHHGENSMPPHYPPPWYSVLQRQFTSRDEKFAAHSAVSRGPLDFRYL